jgi:hypothetical protein
MKAPSATQIEVEQRIRDGNLRKLTDFLLDLSSEGRSALRGTLGKMLPLLRREMNSLDRDWRALRRSIEAAALAGLAVLNFSDLRRLRVAREISRRSPWDEEYNSWTEQAFRILSTLKPEWLDEWLTLLLQDDHRNWTLVRQLIRAGCAEKPDVPDYVYGMIEELRSRAFPYHKPAMGSLRAAILEDADLLQDEIWRIFDHEGTTRCSLAARECGAKENDSWRMTLLSLCEEGKLSRDRLLDRSLDAISRDYKANYSTWFISLHEGLAPTEKEIQARQTRYIALLGSANPATTKFALEALFRLAKTGVLDRSAVLEAIEPALRVKAKGTVKQALRLLERTDDGSRETRHAIARVATAALLNEAPEVQLAALHVIKEFRDEANAEFEAEIQSFCEGLAASVRPKFEQIFGSVSGTVATSVPAEAKPLVQSAQGILPIETLDELLDRAAFAVENPEAVQEWERVLDGLSRLCHLRRANMISYAGPLLKRLRDRTPLEHRALWMFPTGMAMLLLRSWIEGVNYFATGQPEEPSFGTFLTRRIIGMKEHVLSGVSLPLVAAPTEVGGWVNGAELVSRIERWVESGISIPTEESVAAILRLAPDGREKAIGAATNIPGELGEAVRYALGGSNPKVGKTAPLWIAAARRRYPNSADPIIDSMFPDHAPLTSNYQWSIVPTGKQTYGPREKLGIVPEIDQKRIVRPEFFTDLVAEEFYTLKDYWLYIHHLDFVPVLKWAYLTWPNGVESFLVNGALMVANFSDTQAKEYYRALRSTFDLLGNREAEFGPSGALFLGFGMVAKSSEIRTMAGDAVIRMTELGKFKVEDLAQVLRKISLSETYFFGGRLSAVLKMLPHISPRHSTAAQDLVEAFLRLAAC